MADLSGLSTEDLIALKAGRLSDVSTDGLMRLKGGGPVAPTGPKVPLQSRDVGGPALDPLTEYQQQIAADPFTRFAVGAAKPVAGALQLTSEGAKNSVNPLYRLYGMVAAPGFNEIASNVKRTERLGKEGMDQGVGGWNVAGTAGEAMSPLGLYMNKALGAKSVLQRILGGSIFSGGTAISQPSEKTGEAFNSDKLAELIIGTAGGAAIAGAMEVPRFAVKLVRDYFTQAGAKDMSMDYIDKILGGKENTDKLVASIEAKLGSQGKGPVPDYRATTGEMVATNPLASPLLALQKRTSEMPGGISAEWGARGQLNQEAIRSALRTIAGTPDDLAAALKTANENAAANYGPLMNRVVNPQSDYQIFMDQIARQRGIPWTGSASDLSRAAPREVTGFAPTGVQPDNILGSLTGKAGALQQWGKAATDEAVQTGLANSWTPVAGMPRVAGRYSPNAEVAAQASGAAKDALSLASTRQREADFTEALMSRMENSGMLTKDSIDPLVSRPSMSDAISYARKLAAEKGYKFPSSIEDGFSVQNLHDIKLGLDAGIRSGSMRDPVTGATTLDNSTLAAMSKTKDAFLNWFESKVPAYGKARVEFAKDMTPVNQMRVGQSLLEKLTMPTGKESPGSFLRALSDEARLIKSSTGQPRGELDKILNPRQMETVNEVGSILENKLASLSPVQKTNLGGNAAADGGLQLPSILSRPVVVANWLLSYVHKGDSPVEQRVNKIMSEWMLNPERFTAAVKTMRASDQQSLFKLLSDAGIDPVRTGMIAPATSFLTEQNAAQ